MLIKSAVIAKARKTILPPLPLQNAKSVRCFSLVDGVERPKKKNVHTLELVLGLTLSTKPFYFF
jgi:hypothetical protein